MAILSNIFDRYGDRYFMPRTMDNGPAYTPIKRRGHWSCDGLDFLCGCLGPSLGTMIFSELPVYILLFGGVYIVPAFLLGIVSFTLPLIALQTFLGQFSTTGFISVFRLAPICQGLGYCFLLLNFICLTFHGLWAAVPLLYAFYSLQPSLPWMHCNNSWNSQNCSIHEDYDEEIDPHAIVEFFRYLTPSAAAENNFSMSWNLVGAVSIIWPLVFLLHLKSLSFLGKCLRWLGLLIVSLFLVSSIHLLIRLDVNWSLISTFLQPTLESSASIWSGIRSGFLLPTWFLGPGCASMLTLASYNRFGVRSNRITYILSGFHVLTILLILVTGRLALDHFEDHIGLFHYHVEEDHHLQFIYLCYIYLLASLPHWPNFWSFLFFLLLFLAEFSAIIVQWLSITTALFDEFPSLRQRRFTANLILMLFMSIISVFYCTKFGFGFLLHQLPLVTTLIHLVLLLFFLLTINSFYGRKCLKRDYEIMYGQGFPFGGLFILRLVTPICLAVNIIYLLLEKEQVHTGLMIILQILIYSVIPCYALVLLCLKQHRSCFRSKDWHPLNDTDQYKYMQAVGNIEMFILYNSEQHG